MFKKKEVEASVIPTVNVMSGGKKYTVKMIPLDCYVEKVEENETSTVEGLIEEYVTFTQEGDKYLGTINLKEAPLRAGNIAISVPANVLVEIKDFGSPKHLLIKDKIVQERLLTLINVESTVDLNLWDKLSNDEKAEFYGINVSDLYDKLIAHLKSGEKRGTPYFQVLLTASPSAPPTKDVQTFKEVESPTLENVDIDVYINNRKFHLYEGSKYECKDENGVFKTFHHYHFMINPWEFFGEV
ncbi:MAG: hypothetical protein NTY95_17605 [Bacteroidia bacterium]|nr:hypothetical protein [Bacteroidia bacterium]